MLKALVLILALVMGSSASAREIVKVGGFEADPAILAKTFRITLVNDNAASIELILKERGDVAVVTDSYLKRYLNSHLDAASKLLVSDQYDQRYAHRALVRRNTAITVADLNRLFAAMEKDHSLDRIWRDFGIKD